MTRVALWSEAGQGREPRSASLIELPCSLPAGVVRVDAGGIVLDEWCVVLVE
jgi:hypothetical protein